MGVMVRWRSQSEPPRIPCARGAPCNLIEKQKSGGIVPSIVKAYTARFRYPKIPSIKLSCVCLSPNKAKFQIT